MFLIILIRFLYLIRCASSIFVRRYKIIRYGAMLVSLLVFVAGSALSATQVFSVDADLFDLAKPSTLGLVRAPEAESFKVFTAKENESQYNHGAVLIAFKGKLYAQWQSSICDEDAPDTHIKFSESESGEHWSAAKILMPARANAVVTNGGWWSDGEQLVAFINVWPKALSPRGGFVEYILSKDGEHWSAPKRLKMADGSWVQGVIEQDLRSLPNGRILTALHAQPGLIAKPFYTDDASGLTGWRFGEMENLEHSEGISRELEPSWFLRKDKSVVMIFRDQAGSFRTLASESRDMGSTWSKPQVTNLLDSRAKQSAGNLPSGGAFIVNNPSGSKLRIPLVISLSDDGYEFNRAYLVRDGSELPKMKYEGKYKRIGYSYPKSYVWGDNLFVAYAVNKEDIAVTKIPTRLLQPLVQ